MHEQIRQWALAVFCLGSQNILGLDYIVGSIFLVEFSTVLIELPLFLKLSDQLGHNISDTINSRLPAISMSKILKSLISYRIS